MRVAAPAALGAILASIAIAAPGSARAVEEDVPSAVGPPTSVLNERIASFTIGMLVGSGYGWSKGTGDVNADIQFSGGSRASLGHVIVEGGVLFPRVRLFLLTGPRLQVVSGTTDLYAGSGEVYQPRWYGRAWFTKFGWLPRGPEARLQPYLLVSSGYGNVIHLARLDNLPNQCGPAHDQTCVDTITAGPYFLGAGTGVRYRMARHLDAIFAIDALLGAPDRTYNFDFNLGLAFVL
jgi:hypothetical protein